MNPETRKVQITGGSTFIISLPKAWAESSNIEKGDSLTLWPRDDGHLIVEPRMVSRDKRKEVILSEESPAHILRRLVGLYMAGHRQMKLKTEVRMSQKTRNAIRELTRRVVGTEIVEESGDFVLVQDFLDPSDLPLDRTVRRMFVMASSMFKDSIISVGESDPDLAKDVQLRDDEIDRLYWLVAKQFNMVLKDPILASKMGMTSLECLNYRAVARTIERIADHACKIAAYSAELQKADVNPATMKLIEDYSLLSADLFEKSVQAFYERDLDLANKTIDMADKESGFRKKLARNIPKEDSTFAVALAFISDSIERVASYSANIAEIAINHVTLKES
ncbi:MAG: PhoU domain-containing protein [Thermoplasmata archaeon]